ncbi:GNAT family N-acetyltransferase [Nostoc sp. TCL26-01]|uniref:GNAT family N-acetyltransferase n=1 Tax=Nostoc sp. TCL26-01 TaxID=2576904 RepID=UPI002117D6D3|nr:GNAT family N-acetyltransferase [Nostoc sp. TCL26-01]
MQIRKLVHQEIDTVIEFLQAMLDAMASFGGHALQDPHSVSSWFRDSIQSQIESPNHLFLVAELNVSSSQLIGVLEASIIELHSVFLPKSSLHIHAIYVVPEHRCSGVARSLMKAAFQWGRDNGCTEADLNVLRNSPAKLFYEGLGFEAFQIEMRRKL